MTVRNWRLPQNETLEIIYPPDDLKFSLHNPPMRTVLNQTGWGPPALTRKAISNAYWYGEKALVIKPQARKITVQLRVDRANRDDYWAERSNLISKLSAQLYDPFFPEKFTLVRRLSDGTVRHVDVTLSKQFNFGSSDRSQSDPFGFIETLTFVSEGDMSLYHPTDINSSISDFASLSAQFTKANSEYLSHADDAILDTGDIDFFISCWVYIDSTTSDMGIVGKYVSPDVEYLLRFDNATLRFVFEVGDGAGSIIGTVSSTDIGTVPAIQWLHVVVWHDTTNNEVGIRINDAYEDTASTSGAAGVDTAEFRIGSYDAGNYFDGRISRVGLWKGTKTSALITSLYNSGKGLAYNQLTSDLLADLAAFWELDESSGVRSDSEGSLDLTDNNTVTSGDPPDDAQIYKDISITYSGTWYSYPVIVITGPATDPEILHVEDNIKIAFDTQLADATETLTITLDPFNFSIIDQDGTNSAGLVTTDSDPTLFVLNPSPQVSGGVNTLRCIAASGDANTDFDITYKNRYLGI